MAAAADGHGQYKSGDLSKSFGMKALGWTAKTVLIGGAIFAGTFFVESFMDYGLIHSEQWASSPLAEMASEFMRPLAEGMNNFFATDFGSGTLTVLEEFFKGIHRLFGVEDTFLANAADGLGAAPDLSGVISGDMGASDVGTAVDFSDGDDGLLDALEQG